MKGSRQRLRLGTRGSRLAVAQSRLIAAALERLHPGLQVELQAFDTRGDRDQQTALRDVRDGHFFSDTLDLALLDGRVDFCVHSRKDLDGNRPNELMLAAMPHRADPRDVILWRGEAPALLAAGETLRLGASSLRRQLHVERFLQEYLPATGRPPRLAFRTLRGPVDQRVRRLTLARSDPQALDGVILALAGLERLWNDANGQRSLAGCLPALRWQVLPLSECPAAPGQGALAIECRRSDRGTAELLATLHDETTQKLVDSEYQAARGQSDGFAATAVIAGDLGELLFTRDAEGQRGLLWQQPPRPKHARAWDGGAWSGAAQRTALPIPPLRDGALFIAHWHALPDTLPPATHQRLWVSGTRSWRELASRGYWVEGCADNLGFDAIRPTLRNAVLGLPPLENWTALTRRGAEDSWSGSGIGRVLASYARDDEPRVDTSALRKATHCFWGSASQYRALAGDVPVNAEHACGNGKTAAALRAIGLKPQVFPNRTAWREWLG
jgi:hydroxymethylbilane synthase